MKEIYWADDEVRHLTSKCLQHLANWGTAANISSMFSSVSASWRRNLLSYYGPLINANDWTTSLGFGGSQGELVSMTDPMSRTLIQQLVSLITRQRLTAEVIVESTDAATFQTGKVGKALLEAMIRDQGLDKKRVQIAEKVFVQGSSFMTCLWRDELGEQIGIEQSEDGNEVPKYIGDNSFEVPDIRDVAYDWSTPFAEANWVIFRLPRNKYDLAAMYPDLRDKILAQPSVTFSRQSQPDLGYMALYTQSDLIFQNCFFHLDTPGVPGGRMTYFLDDGTPIRDDNNIYGCLPITQFCFEEMIGTGLGYAMLSSMLPMQEMLDHSLSVQATNQSAFGVQSVMVPDGANLSAKSFEGLNFITYRPQGVDGGGKPEPLQLTATPPEVSQFANNLGSRLEQTSGLNSALRGNPAPGVTSGTAIATLSANAQEFLSLAQSTMDMGFEKAMMMGLKNQQKFGQPEGIIECVGRNNVSQVVQFKNEQLATIKRIKIRNGNPLMNTIAGRLQIAENITKAGVQMPLRNYFNLLDGAPVDVLFETELDENIAVQSEIDALLNGETVVPNLLDNHPVFIRALQGLIYDQKIRRNSAILGAVTEVIQERYRLELQLDPQLKMMLRTGNQLMMNPQGPGPQGGGGGPSPDMMTAPDEAAAAPAQPTQPQASV